MKSILESYLKQHGYFVFLALLLLPIIFESCKPQTTQEERAAEETDAPDTLPADFISFFDRFHQDSVYQLNHILFPLEGLPNSTGDADTVPTQRFFWKKEEWKKHNPFTDPSKQFDHWYEVLDKRIIEHWVQMKGTNLVIRRRFAKMDDEWFLIYYAGMRPLIKEQQ